MAWIKRNKSIFMLSVFLLISGCSNTEQPKERCTSDVLNFMFIVDQMIGESTIDSVDDQAILRSEILRELNFLTKKIIEQSGGIVPNSDQLYAGCQSSAEYYDYYNKYILNTVGPKYEALNSEDQLSQKYILTMNKYFYSDDPYFDKEYFNKVKINQLSNDLLISQVSLMHPIEY